MACSLVIAKPLSEAMLKIVNSIPGNKLQWILNRNSFILIQENAFENIAWKMAAVLFGPQYVNDKRQKYENTLVASAIFMFFEFVIYEMT